MIKNIVLYGQNAVNFYNRIYHPSKDQIEEIKISIAKNQQDISIIEETSNGLIAIVRNLDLTFLNNI